MISQLTAQDPDLDRKNIMNSIKWIFETHKDDKDVGIVLKTNFGRGSKRDKIVTTNFLKSVINQFRKSEYPRVYLLHGNMTKKEIAGIYHNSKIKTYVTATRGEGYGLPLIEAASAGMPILATNWSGHLEFLKNKKFVPVDYNLVSIDKRKVDNRIFFENFKWAEPDKESFQSSLVEIKQNYSRYKSIAVDYSSEVQEKFCKQNIKKMYDNLLDGII
jgi:glycosyltransferase involved in cell wall biosynthesis